VYIYFGEVIEVIYTLVHIEVTRHVSAILRAVLKILEQDLWS